MPDIFNQASRGGVTQQESPTSIPAQNIAGMTPQKNQMFFTNLTNENWLNIKK